MSSPSSVIHTDVVIVGAGPVGLFQVFELGLQGLSAHVVDALPQAGGQCTELYPDKPIYDIPAVPICTGQQLTDQLLEQIRPFDPVLHFDQTVDELERLGDLDFRLKTSGGLEFRCRSVVVAAGAGSFTPVRLRVDGIEKFEGKQLFYRVRDRDAHSGKDIVLLGGGDSALDWALALAESARSLTVINRTERFRAAPASLEKLQALESAGKARILYGAISEFRETDGQLSEVTVALREGANTASEALPDGLESITLPVDHLMVFFGMSPKLGAVENWGLDLERKLVTVNLATYETSTPDVYAIGDINTYEGKKKLILSGFHEAALAAYAIKSRFDPDKKINVQYTTTSPVMHKRLGVEKPGA